jgi:alkylhydroperoxidase family enzyme
LALSAAAIRHRIAPSFEGRANQARAWTEAVTRIADIYAPDFAYEALRPHFSQKEIADLTILIGMINLWNRLMTSFRAQHPVERVKAA